MKTDALFADLERHGHIAVLKETNESIQEAFEQTYLQFKDRLFFEQFMRSGGVLIDGWVRLYGCGLLNVIEKNVRYNKNGSTDILIGEDVLGGLFGLEDDLILYFAPDTNEWEFLDVSYSQFVFWLVNNGEAVNTFYEPYRWNTWKTDCAEIGLDKGFSFYPSLQSACGIEERSRRAISIDELIRFNLGI